MSDLYVYLIRSRNKDNKDVPNFKERAKTILEYKENEDKVIDVYKRQILHRQNMINMQKKLHKE